MSEWTCLCLMSNSMSSSNKFSQSKSICDIFEQKILFKTLCVLRVGYVYFLKTMQMVKDFFESNKVFKTLSLTRFHSALVVINLDK